MSLKTVSYVLLILILLLGGFFNKVIPINLTVALVLLFVALNIRRRHVSRNIMNIYFVFAFLFLSSAILGEFVYSKPPSAGYEPDFSATKSFALIGRMLGYVLFSYCLSLLPLTEKQLGFVWVSLLFTSLLVALFCILEYHYGYKLVHGDSADIVMLGVFRVRGPFGDPNASAAMILPGIFVAISFLIAGKLSHILAAAILVVLLYGMYTTSSRTALIGLFVPLVVILITRNEKISPLRQIAYLVLSAIAAIGLTSLYLQNRGLSIFSDSSSYARLLLIKQSFADFSAAPFFGSGLSHYHNLYSDMLVTGGISMFTSFVILLFAILYRSWRFRRYPNSQTHLVILLSFLVVGLGISWTQNIVLWALIGLGMNASLTRAVGSEGVS